MKELSIEEKAKAYDKVIESGKSLLSDNEIGNAWIYKLLPELEESEGEKIRKDMIETIKKESKDFPSSVIAEKSHIWISWLEKQGEQKPVEWSIFDYRTWQHIVSDVLTKRDGIGQYLDDGECKKIAKYMQEEWSKRLSVEQRTTELPKGEDYGIDGLYAAIDILQKTLGEVDGYQSDDGILEHKCAISAVKKLYEQNPWSEEDERHLNNIINRTIAYGDSSIYGLIKDDIAWLKSIKDKVQPKQEWSEEDENRFNNLILLVKDSNEGEATKNGFIGFINKLKKSLRPQATWTPSDEQMNNK